MKTLTSPPETPEATVMQLVGRLSGGGRDPSRWPLPGGCDPVATALWHLGDHLAHSDRREHDVAIMSQAISMLDRDTSEHSQSAWRVCLDRLSGGKITRGPAPLQMGSIWPCVGRLAHDGELELETLNLNAGSHSNGSLWHSVLAWWLTRRISRQANQIVRIVPGERPVSGRRCAATIVAILIDDPRDEVGRGLALWLARALGPSATGGVPAVIDPVGEVVTAMEVFHILGLDRAHAPVRVGLARLDRMIRRLLERRSGRPPCRRTLARSATTLWAMGDSANQETSRLALRSLMMGKGRGQRPWRHIAAPCEMAAITAALASIRSWSHSSVTTAIDHLLSLRGDDGLWVPQGGGAPLMETAKCLMALQGEGIDRSQDSLTNTRKVMCRSQGSASDPDARAAVAASRRVLGDMESDLGTIVSGDLQRLVTGVVAWSDPDIFPVMVTAVGVTVGSSPIARLGPSITSLVEPSHNASEVTAMRPPSPRPATAIV